MRMKNPPHPGRIVRQECIEPLGLTVTETAKRLGVTRQALNNLVNGKGGISAEMAVRLSKAFGSSPEVWLGMQMEYDLAQVEKEAHNIKGETGCVRLLIHGDEPARSGAHVELRTMPQGHPDYRFICQEMWRKIQEVHPTLAESGKFIDWQKYRLGRLQSEMRTEFKKSAMQRSE